MDKKKRLYILVMIAFVLGLAGCKTESGDIKVYENTEEETVSHEELTMTAIVTHMDMEQKEIQFVSAENGKKQTLLYHGGVRVLDTNGKDISIKDVVCGSVLDVTYYGDTSKLVSMKENSRITVSNEVKKLVVNTEEQTVCYNGKSLKLGDYAQAFDGDKMIALKDINTEDELTIWERNGTLLSAVITKGHGYVRLLNQGTYIGGFVEIGKDVIVPVTEDMLVAVGEGDYTLRISKNGYSSEKKVKVTRDREIKVDLSDVAIPSGTVTFALNPEDTVAEIKVDNAVIENKTYTGLYGEHELSIKAEGYDDFRGSFRISNTTKTLNVTLQKEDTEETTETTESTDTSSTTGTDGTTNTTSTSGTQNSTTETSSNNTTAAQTTTTQTITTQTEQTTAAVGKEYKITISAPEGVGVYLDGDYVGIAPVSFKKTAGTHTITLYKAGYLIRSYTIQAVDDGTDDEYSYEDLISVLE